MTITADSIAAGLDASTVMVQNMMPGPTVIAADAHRNYEIIFQGNGHPDGEDVQPVPDHLLRTPQFIKALRQGIFGVIEGADHPVVVAAMSRQSDAFRKRMDADAVAARESLDAVSQNDLVVVTCIGPGTREGVVCGEMVPVRDREQAERPPLCARHQHLTDFCTKRGSQPWKIELA